VRARLAVLLGAHVVTRAILAVFAAGDRYPFGFGVQVLGDTFLYDRYADAVLAGGRPYLDVAIEYPPGVLPAILAPQLAGGDPGQYRLAFVVVCLLLDAAVLAAVLRLARRTGRVLTGAWVWVLGVALLGPLAFLRLDLLPTAAAVWAVERGTARRWGTAGALLGYGAAAKVFPGLLAVPALAAAVAGPAGSAPRRSAVRLVVGGVLGGLATLALAGPGVVAMARSVLGYHLERGIQIESVWATPLLVAARLGAPVRPLEVFGAWHVDGWIAPAVEQVATAGALAALAAGTWLTVRAVRTDPEGGMAAGLCATILLLLATGSVLSPQYVVWALGLGGAALAATGLPLRRPVLLLLPVALATQVVYPVLYEQLLGLGRRALLALALRNALLVTAALWSAIALWRATRRTTPAPAALDPATTDLSPEPATPAA
jgi:hypothetical protein